MLEEEEKYQLPPDFLLEMMELNEELSDESAARIASIEKELYSEIASIIENYNDERIREQELQKLKAYYYKKKYLKRILDRLAG